MPVILITQESGSRGDEIAARIAANLGLELIAQERIERRVAESLKISKLTVRHLLEGTASLVERLSVGRHRLVRHMAMELVKLAGQGNAVVQCWEASGLLRLVRHIYWVKVSAPGRQDTSVPEMPLCCRSQRTRGGGRWPSTKTLDGLDSYDLVLETDRLSIEECVERVRCKVQEAQFQPPAASLAMTVGLLQEAQGGATRALEVDVEGRRIRLPAGVSAEEGIARIEQYMRGKQGRGRHATLHSLPDKQRCFF